MEIKQLLIDNRFKVDTPVNTVIDLETGRQSRLEPRLMKLLLLLTAHAGELVSREIWNDYGGAEDGLNQAISFLRKVFDDAQKERIRTIPKKGYLLNAAVAVVSAETISSTTSVTSTLSPTTKANKKNQLILTAVILSMIIVLIFGRKIFSPGSPEPREPAGTIEDTLYQYKEMQEQR